MFSGKRTYLGKLRHPENLLKACSLENNTTSLKSVYQQEEHIMADRFPSLEDFDSGGGFQSPTTLLRKHTNSASDAKGASALDLDPTATSGEDFLTRERAALGDDATLFASGNDSAAFVEDDDDLLGGGGGNEEIHEFQSSFPAIDTRNHVCVSLIRLLAVLIISGYGTWRHHHWQHLPIFIQCSFRRART
jgi:hypothetical protein